MKERYNEMIFYLTIKTDKPLDHVPFIDSILLTIDGEEKLCTWDETDGNLEISSEGNFVNYRLKGVSYATDDIEWEYANGSLKEYANVAFEDINWQEDDDAEEFDFEIESLEILDYDYDNNEEMKIVVVDVE